MSETGTRAGFVAVIGAPNAGKSTLVNALVGQKVAIVSAKAQTTRARLMGIAIQGGAQILLVDTPGIFQPKRRLDRAMVAAAWSGAEDAELILLVIDSGRGITAEVERAIVGLDKRRHPLFIALNKIDLVKKEKLLALSLQLTDRLYPEDEVSDATDRMVAAELTREQIYEQLHQELPYSSAVETETWEDRPDGSAEIRQQILVERDSQKAIVIGKGGARLKEIGQRAREAISEHLGRKVHLFLHVKVNPKWGEDRSFYRDIGLEWSD
jgi:GTP-binding protein Era